MPSILVTCNSPLLYFFTIYELQIGWSPKPDYISSVQGLNRTGFREMARKGVQSVETAFPNLDCLERANGPMPLSDLAACANISNSKARNYLVSLIATDQVRQEPVSGYYEMGPSTLRHGITALGRIDAIGYCLDDMARLQHQTQETLFITIWGNKGPTIIRWFEGRRPVTVELRTGSVLPILSTATGRVFLAYMPPSLTESLVKAELAEAEERGKTYGVQALKSHVLKHQLAKADGEYLPGISALAVPIIDFEKRVRIVVSAIGRRRVFDASFNSETAAALKTLRRAFRSGSAARREFNNAKRVHINPSIETRIQ